jgi:hypothetical protein
MTTDDEILKEYQKILADARAAVPTRIYHREYEQVEAQAAIRLYRLAESKCKQAAPSLIEEAYSKGKTDGLTEAANEQMQRLAKADHEHFPSKDSELIRCKKCYAKGKADATIEWSVKTSVANEEAYAKGQADLIEKLTSDNLAFLLIGISESYYMDCQQIRESGFGDEQYKRKLWREEIKAAIKKASESLEGEGRESGKSKPTEPEKPQGAFKSRHPQESKPEKPKTKTEARK